MRLAIAGISHETNTYCHEPTPLRAFYTYRGEKMFSAAGQESDLGGAIDAANTLGVEVVPTLFASTQPSGIIESAAYAALKQEILERLAQAMPLDGCVLLLHGAGVVEGIPDLEADLAAAVRSQLGDIPIAGSFDLHGNVTQHMADQLNGVFACHQYPHVDLHERAAEAVRCVVDMHTSGVASRCEVFSVPMLLPTTTTFEGIGRQVLQQVLELEQTLGCIDVSWFHGFPYADVAHVGSFIVVTHREDQTLSRTAVEEFIADLWGAREQFRPNRLSAEQAVEAALDDAAGDGTGPVVIHETSDNCGAGTPGDGTHLLRAITRSACTTIIR